MTNTKPLWGIQVREPGGQWQWVYERCERTSDPARASNTDSRREAEQSARWTAEEMACRARVVRIPE